MCTYSMAAWTPSKYAVFVTLSLSSTEFRKIPWKHRNSTEMGKFRSSAENSAFRGKLWSLLISASTISQASKTYLDPLKWTVHMARSLQALGPYRPAKTVKGLIRLSVSPSMFNNNSQWGLLLDPDTDKNSKDDRQ